jgi:putative radical SAM enzyme (TIGR03279 family)
MSVPKVTALLEGSPAAAAGLRVGDELISLNGAQPRDVIEYQHLVDAARLDVVVRRAGSELDRRIRVDKGAGEPLGLEVSAAVFDRVRTCDNHCAFCFIYQLPKGMRKSLYLKDDDYRLSFLYGNFTTLTRFTELDAERVITERLGPLFVSIHATDPEVRASMLRNPRGATSLRWLSVLLDAGIEVHGQVVVCPGVNDGPVLEDTMVGILDRYPALATVGVVPLGLSRFSNEPDMRPHTVEEAARTLDTVHDYQSVSQRALGRRLVFASDEYYLMAGRPVPDAAAYEGYPQHENGIGMVQAFRESFAGDAGAAQGVRPGFFAWVDGAPPAGYRAPRAPAPAPASCGGPPTVLTGTFGATVLEPLLAPLGVPVLTVENRYFGGTIGVAGLLTAEDVARVLAEAPDDRRYLLPDACLSKGFFLDGGSLADLPRAVEVVPTDGLSLRRALEANGP